MKKDKLYNAYDITNCFSYSEICDDVIFIINYKDPIELKYENLKVKFGKKLIKYLNNIKNDDNYFNRIYDKYFELWKKTAIDKKSSNLFNLIDYLTKREAYNIKNFIFSSVTNEKLKEPIYYKFISEFSNL